MTLHTFRLYEHPSAHEVVSGIIRRHSSNPRDVREVALADHDLSGVRDVLDLGCGFGFMAEEVARRVRADAMFTGVDVLESNGPPFTRRVRAVHRHAHFVSAKLSRHLEWPAGSLDLVVSGYSLYFFPQIVPEIARVLRPEGRFMCVTHSEAGLRDMLRLAGVPEEESPLLALVRGFSAENGAEVLGRWFDDVTVCAYPNVLRFGPSDIEELLTYLRYKFASLREWPESEPELSALAAEELKNRILADEGAASFDKTDAVFWAARPRSGARAAQSPPGAEPPGAEPPADLPPLPGTDAHAAPPAPGSHGAGIAARPGGHPAGTPPSGPR